MNRTPRNDLLKRTMSGPRRLPLLAALAAAAAAVAVLPAPPFLVYLEDNGKYQGGRR